MNIPPKNQGDIVTRKTYTAPKLETYGSVSRITQAKGGTKNDGGGAPSTKANG